MNIQNNLNDWELQKAGFLLIVAGELGMASEDGELAVNPNSGYVYLWSEMYPFTLYMPIYCELRRKDVYVLWSNPETGEEQEISLENFQSLNDIEEWVSSLEGGMNEAL